MHPAQPANRNDPIDQRGGRRQQQQPQNNAPLNELGIGVDPENTRGNLQLKKRFSGAFQ
eukprot:COSAG06_NODE_25051_length_646_cov_2.414991_2_plen_58_part_01